MTKLLHNLTILAHKYPETRQHLLPFLRSAALLPVRNRDTLLNYLKPAQERCTFWSHRLNIIIDWIEHGKPGIPKSREMLDAIEDIQDTIDNLNLAHEHLQELETTYRQNRQGP